MSGKWSTTKEVEDTKEQFLLCGCVLLVYPEVVPEMRKVLLMDPRWQCAIGKEPGSAEKGVRAPCAYCKTNLFVDPTTCGYTAQKWDHDPVWVEDLDTEIWLLSRVYTCKNDHCPEVCACSHSYLPT